MSDTLHAERLKWLRRKLRDASRDPGNGIAFRCGAGYARAITYLCWDDKGNALPWAKASKKARTELIGRSGIPLTSHSRTRVVRLGNARLDRTEGAA